MEDIYHTTAQHLPLNKFIDCIVDNNLQSLTISGFPKEEQLRAAWSNIMSEYSDLIGSQEYRLYIEMLKEVSILKISIDQIALGLGVIRYGYSKIICDEINNLLKTNCSFNWSDQKTYQDECDKCERRAKAFKIKYDLKSLQFEAIQKKNEEGDKKPLNRQYFTSILITLSDHAKYRIEETIKIPEYCERIKRFSEYCRQQSAKNTT